MPQPALRHTQAHTAGPGRPQLDSLQSAVYHARCARSGFPTQKCESAYRPLSVCPLPIPRDLAVTLANAFRRRPLCTSAGACEKVWRHLPPARPLVRPQLSCATKAPAHTHLCHSAVSLGPPPCLPRTTLSGLQVTRTTELFGQHSATGEPAGACLAAAAEGSADGATGRDHLQACGAKPPPAHC